MMTRYFLASRVVGDFSRYFCWSIQVNSKITPRMNIAPIVIHSTAFHTVSPVYSNPKFSSESRRLHRSRSCDLTFSQQTAIILVTK